MFTQIGPIPDKDERAQLVKILATNGYTVRITRQKRGKSNAYEYFVEFEQTVTVRKNEA